MSKIIISYGVPMEGFHSILHHELIYPNPLQSFSKEEMLALLPDADAVLAVKPFDRDMMAAAKQIKLIVCYGAGYDSIDIAAATAHGIVVANIPDTVTAPTAELAIAHIMSCARRMTELDKLVRTKPADEVFVLGDRMGTSIEGSVLGIVGMGRIGSRVADFGRIMGMKVLYTARTPKPQRDALGDEHVSLETLMAQSDFISVHCPLTPQTRGLISRELLASAKPNAYIINTARGPVIDEEALIEALEHRRIRGAGLDVFTGEPIVDPRLLALDNVILTPHIGSNTEQARRQMAEAASAAITAMLAGGLPDNIINPEVLPS